MKPRLMAVSGPLRGSMRPVFGQLSIGRDEANELCLLDRSVSRRHCVIQPVENGFEIADLESHNGTFVNGVPITRKPLQHGDTIRIGSSELVFLVHDSASATNLVLSEKPSSSSDLRTVRVDRGELEPAFGVEVGRMARDLSALFRIGNIINSIRDAEELQRQLLQLILEVVPAESGAIVLLPNLDDDPTSVCSWSRTGERPSMDIRRDLVQRAVWEQSAVFTIGSSGAGETANILCMPLAGVEKTLGVIYLTSQPPAAPFREEYVHFLMPVSRIAAVTLEHILALDDLRSENRRLREELDPVSKLVGESRQMAQVEEFIARVANSDSTVLIRGESGTGKELVARAIHHNSPRSDRPFIAINCGAIPENLLESELFGHEKGAFTGAIATRKGKLEIAEDGTVFLDEIGEMAPPLQVKLLRVLQQKEFERLGGERSLPFKARIIAATHKNLEQAMKASEFRQDLYYRLNVVSVTVSPLRERRQDIPLLALYFLAKYGERSKRPVKGISREARALLMNYSWPGNVRELENAIEHAVVLGLTEEILPEDLPGAVLEEQSADLENAQYHDVLNKTKKTLLLNALQEAKGNYPEAARLLGIHPKYLHRLVRTLNLKTELKGTA